MLLGLIEIKRAYFGGEVGLMYTGARAVEKIGSPQFRTPVSVGTYRSYNRGLVTVTPSGDPNLQVCTVPT
jgi:hypothetical protein